MTDCSIRKIGFGGKQDLKSISKLTGLEVVRDAQRTGFLDMQRFAAEQMAMAKNISIKEAMEGLSLSRLVAETLGLPLDKTMQLSAWEERPLSNPQIRYAALDA